MEQKQFYSVASMGNIFFLADRYSLHTPHNRQRPLDRLDPPRRRLGQLCHCRHRRRRRPPRCLCRPEWTLSRR